MRALVIDTIAPEGIAFLRVHGFEVDQIKKPSPEELHARIGDYEAIVTRSSTAVTPELLDHAKRLRIIGRAGVGVDNIDIDPENLERVEVVVGGQLARRDPELLTRALLVGLLDLITDQTVNLVNARIVAAERGLGISVTAEEAAGGYTNLLTVTTYTRQGRKIIAGTVFDGTPRIVRLRDLHIDFVPEGDILVLSYEDRPGMVGKIGSVLGRHNVNIASMHVGRREKRGRAIVVLLLDEDLTGELLGEVARAVEADFARMIRL
ncbi:MAG: ACT domain-containing protein [Candidatus Rokubacteria bacterium]|nr:ACT domain-containing protein [Candidatus Rokubacteria bacterium]